MEQEAPIRMVDLVRQFAPIREEVLQAVTALMDNAAFIGGQAVQQFADNLSAYVDGAAVIPCANGTDALQIALMALDLQPGDEVIVPSFTYVATAEVIALLRLRPVMVDVDAATFNLNAELVHEAIGSRTRAVVPVHLFGQCVDMDPLLQLAAEQGLQVVEDAAQAIGARYHSQGCSSIPAGTMGAVGCTSFFPSKNLGAFGDGGAMFTRDAELAAKLRMIANHGQSRRYYHDRVGVNSRLDAIQAAVLDVKLRHLDRYQASRQAAADRYDAALAAVSALTTPVRAAHSSHVFHQYTLRVADGQRDALKAHLEARGIPAMIYYPVPLNEQKAFLGNARVVGDLPVTRQLCDEVLSLPMHSELDEATQQRIIDGVLAFFLNG